MKGGKVAVQIFTIELPKYNRVRESFVQNKGGKGEILKRARNEKLLLI